jgi:iron complex outermembrane receptor protein
MSMMRNERSVRSARGRLAATSSAAVLAVALLAAGSAHAADAAAPAGGGTGAEGSEVSTLVVQAESTQVTSTAPTKGSLDETQPESIITHKFIEQATPETGGWTTVALIAPSVAGITSNGGGIGDYNVVTMRGFKDGNFNLTFDGIAFGDTNDPTHHGADYFPASTIGATVVDRGPGAAGDLGQENYGGAIHFFTPLVNDAFGVVQKVTYGTFSTYGVVTTINTGAISQLGGAKLLLNFDERGSNGELSNSGGHQENQMAKLVMPFGDSASLTIFAQHEINYFNFEDSAGPGETWQQEQLVGKNFSMNRDPGSEHFTGYNFELKRTDFEYIDFKDDFTKSVHFEDQLYTYWYSNKTKSTNDLTGVLGPDMNFVLSGGPNTSPPQAKGANPNDIGGYDKLNEYRVIGDIVRLNKDWSFGTLKIGGLVEGSRTFRHNCFIDDTLGGAPDIKFKPPTVTVATNCKLLEESSWLQWQAFFDFNWRVTDQLTVSPGFKYVDFTRNLHATNENVAGAPTKNQPIFGSNNYTSPLYFITANYRVLPVWSVYGQVATGFLIPALSSLYVTGFNLQKLKPQQTTNYQLGTVYTNGPITADADVYLIDATNLQVSCNVADPQPGNPNFTEPAFCNAGNGRYDGVEGEAAYAFSFGLTLFANGSYNNASVSARVANAPKWTAAAGGVYAHGPWEGAVTYKKVGDFWDGLSGYDTVNVEAAYDFGRVKVKVQVENLLDRRAATSYTAGGNSGALFSVLGKDGLPDGAIYTFQAGREVEVTLIGKF